MKNRLRSMFIAAVLVGTVVAGSFTAGSFYYQQDRRRKAAEQSISAERILRCGCKIL